MNQVPSTFWCELSSDALVRLRSTTDGLSNETAAQRLADYGANLLKPQKRSNALTLLLAQFKSPIILILLFASGLSFVLRDPVNAVIILSIVVVSGLLGFWQEHSANNAIEKLLAVVQIRAKVLCDGSPREIAVHEVVPGGIVILGAGDVVPGDCQIAVAKDLFVDEATLQSA